MFPRLLWLCVSLLGLGTSSAGEAVLLPRTNLMVFHSRSGGIHPVHSVREWQIRRSDILKSMQQITGPLPGREKRGALDVMVEEEIDRGSYIQRLITYQSEPGSRVPAYLLLPKARTAKAPAVLALHSTDAEYGHRVLVEHLRPHYRAFGRDLAERGFVVLAPAYPHLANYAPDLKALGYRSGTMKAIWDNIRGLDLLERLPGVRHGHYAAFGHSLGGHNAIYTAVFDDRIQAVVSSCGFDSFADYMGGNITGWTSERYMPALAAYHSRVAEIPFDFPELLGALAPRKVFINAPLHDSNFRYGSVVRVVNLARPVYQLYGAADGLQTVHPDCGHDFPGPVREQAYQFLAGF